MNTPEQDKTYLIIERNITGGKEYKLIRKPARPNARSLGSLHLLDNTIWNLNIIPPLRGRGLARELLNNVISQTNINPIYLWAKPSPDSNINQNELENFYESVGFVHTNVINPSGKQMVLHKSQPLLLRNKITSYLTQNS